MTIGNYVQPGDHLQRKTRALRVFVDQHGRRWEAWADIATNTPIGEMRPVGFNPPWQPSQPYAKFAPNGDPNFVWEYQRLADELAGMTAAYYDDATRFAIQHNLPVPEVGGVVDRRIKALLGVPPFSPAIPLACAAGDAWLLGDPNAVPTAEMEEIVKANVSISGNAVITEIKRRIEEALGRKVEIPQEAAPVVEAADFEAGEVTYQQFFAAGKKEGKSATEISALWKAHKDALAGV